MIENLDRPLAQLSELTTADLSTMQSALERSAELLKKRKETFEALLLRRFEADARVGYQEAKKDTGIVRISAPGSNLLDLKIEVDKTVVWDQTALLAWLNTLPKADAQHYGKLKVEVAEAKFTNAPPAVQEILKPMRAIKPGKMKFTFVQRDVDAAQEAA